MSTLDNPFGIFDPKHWTNTKARKSSAYSQTLGKPYLRSVLANKLLKQLDLLDEQGKKDGKQWRYLVNTLHSLGEGDYDERDHGNDIKNTI